ncbi:uncharacterized protein LOC122023018 [Zingiber officinale]|uniref:uncharacterized protein LOC122023018 n=1 Tax=Zingiber officinale TaxID=94328 RepID=UPI001C4C1AF0|nr:uncharacterized protein LOC122023018 [Zingiber officinale]
MGEDRSWMYFSRWVPEFENGLLNFLNISFAKASSGGQIKCPCRRCKNRYWYRRDEVYNHVKSEGFVENYDLWIFHGEDPSSLKTTRDLYDDVPRMHDNIDELLHDRFRDVVEETSNVQQGPNEEAKKFYRLVEEGKQELYPGCKNFSKLSFIIRLFIYKTLHGLSNVALNDLLQLLREMIPDAKLPPNFNEARNILRNLGLDCQKIYACPNDCMLFWKEHENDNECHTCHASKWKQSQEKDGKKPNNEAEKKLSNIPAKVLWYFPLKSRLQRLFMCAESAMYMTWHDRGRHKDGNLRHPADGKAWKEFDMLYPDFAKEPRNVRLGLASDGFNPFRTMSIAHSTWPVVLVNYNLPPWMCMKPEYFILSLLIPGPESPGNNIDVYLQPLIDELNELWNDGLATYDKLKNETFQMHAALTWTINDFPAYSMLSGWKTKGKFACPCCNYETSSLYLSHSSKTCYMDHRRFLDLDHPWRRNKSSFNGHTEDRPPPTPLTGVEALRDLSNFKNEFGKTRKKKNDATCPWKKKSIFFELPYWQFNLCRHNLDVMHIEKNICDSLIGTLLDVAGKSKDHAKARFHLIELGIKENLQPELSLDGENVVLQKACYAMSKIEKDIFFHAIKGVKLPYGLCIKHSKVCTHFRKKSGCKVVKLEDLDQLETEIVEILYELEKIFLPAFFDIMMHLPIHLNSGVSVRASTPSFASSRDKNPVVGDVDYYGAIIEIIELNYWSKSKVVLFHCEWYQVEKDEYGLPCVNMKKLCSLNDPYVMPSQVHPVFYVPDPLVDSLQYVMNRVPRDLYEGDYGINDGNTYWSELHDNEIHPVLQVGVEDIQLSREDMCPIFIGANTNLEDINGDDDNDDDDSVDETLWDWMNADEEQEADDD